MESHDVQLSDMVSLGKELTTVFEETREAELSETCATINYSKQTDRTNQTANSGINQPRRIRDGEFEGKLRKIRIRQPS